MADDDRSQRDDPADDDPDRAAILGRRQRFIAIALSGLASAACEASRPHPCLNVVHPGEEGKDTDAQTQGEPHPCLSAVPEPDPEPAPEDPKAKPQP